MEVIMFDAQTIDDMRDWCADTYADYDDSVTDATVLGVIRRNYPGGVRGFIVDGL